MRIGYLVPVDFALGNPGNGIAAQARSQAAALQERGHKILFLNPWQFQTLDELDVLHVFLGGYATYGVEKIVAAKPSTALVMSPIIDSNEPNWKYRAAVIVGSAIQKIVTVPAVLARQARASDAVICRSNFERTRVIEGLGVRQERAAVVLNGGDVPMISSAALQAVKERYELPDKFVLNVSAYTQIRKNALRLAQAVEQLDLPLVLAGHNESNGIGQQLAERARANSKLRLLGFVDRATRDALYGLCHVFCLPSYHEGTGLAALEAGAAAARVVITRNGGPPDYFGKWARYVDPFDVRQIRDAIASEWQQPRNTELAAHVAGRLTWQASAAALEATYQQAIEVRQIASRKPTFA